jgi:putative cell wall-binding protein
VGLGKVIIDMTTKPEQQQSQSPMQQDLESAQTRYDDIWKGMEARRIILETTLLQIERYRRMVRNITIFLHKVEKKMDKLEPVSSDMDTIRKQITDHKVSYDDDEDYDDDDDDMMEKVDNVNK